MGYALLGSAALSAAGSITGALVTAKTAQKQQRLAEAATNAAEADFLAQQEHTNILNDLAQRQNAAAETARIGLFSNLGKPGTYEQNYNDFLASSGQANPSQLYDPTNPILTTPSGFTSDTGPQTAVFGGGHSRIKKTTQEKVVNQGLFNKVTRSVGVKASRLGRDAAGLAQDTAYIVDPNVLQKVITDSPQFRMESFLTAEADQLVRRQGPLYEDLQRSVLAPIYEGAAAQARENAKTISDMVAKGGSARRQGLAAALTIQGIEATNRTRVANTFNSKIMLDNFTRVNAHNVLKFNNEFINNIGGVRDHFNQTFQDITKQLSDSKLGFAKLQQTIDQNRINQVETFGKAKTADAAAFGELISGFSKKISGALLTKDDSGVTLGSKIGTKVRSGITGVGSFLDNIFSAGLGSSNDDLTVNQADVAASISHTP